MKKSLIVGLGFLMFASYAVAQTYKIENVTKAIEDMSKYDTYPQKYLKKLEEFKAQYASKKNSKDFQAEFDKFAREALLQNPLLQENKDWVFIKRSNKATSRGLPANWQGNVSLTKRNPKAALSFNDEMYKMDITNPEKIEPFFKPTNSNGIFDVDINWDADKLLYSSVNKNNLWQIYEYDFNTKKTRLITVEKYEDVDNFDGVYLPDGDMIYMSTASYNSVPCVNGRDYVSNVFKLNPRIENEDARDDTIRRLSFDQESSWYPTVFNDGRVMYTRWEYTDNSHYFARILMKMNPDGTNQMSHYGSTSYWPNSLFFCRPIPGDSNKFVGIVSGHHGIVRSGEIHLFDISKGVLEEEGRVHQYMGMGKEYVARMMDGLVNDIELQFIHPYPLSENYLVVSMRRSDLKPVPGVHIQKVNLRPKDIFSLYLVDKFDNMTELHSFPDSDIFEAMPLSKRERPPIIADKVDTSLDYGHVFLNNIYEGPGLKGVPVGTVKKLRIFEYNYNYRDAGNHEKIGLESSWEVKRVHGTVNVEEDGSAFFQVPANRPYSIQPLDENGRALAIFRSWFTVMPGETLSCVGCHEPSNTAPVTGTAMASRKAPQKIEEFLGKPRGFSFDREIQPILNAYCVECHDGKSKELPNFKNKDIPWRNKNYSNSYLALHPYVRRPGPESNQNIQPPLEFHSSTSELIQLLEKGHKGVNLDDNSKRVLYTWIDLNVPYHGTLSEAYAKKSKGKDATLTPMIPDGQLEKRAFFMKKYANRVDNFETDDPIYNQTDYITYNKRGKTLTHMGEKAPTAEGFPFDTSKANSMVATTKLPKELSLKLDSSKIDLVLIPTGKFVQGSNDSFYDEGPAKLAEVKEPFYMAKFEITNELYNLFDEKHNPGYLDRHWKDHINPGYPLFGKKHPVVRVSQTEAKAFCEWLSKKWGVKVSLPTETQWEWAAKAGSNKDFWFGSASDDFSKCENFADLKTKEFAVTGVNPQPMKDPNEFYAYMPACYDWDDGQLLSADIGLYKANPFGLHDIAGNVAEWVDGNYTETLDGKVVEGKAVARGASWADRPSFAKTTLRRPYYDWQRVYNVGFRIIVEADAKKLSSLTK